MSDSQSVKWYLQRIASCKWMSDDTESKILDDHFFVQLSKQEQDCCNKLVDSFGPLTDIIERRRSRPLSVKEQARFMRHCGYEVSEGDLRCE